MEIAAAMENAAVFQLWLEQYKTVLNFCGIEMFLFVHT